MKHENENIVGIKCVENSEGCVSHDTAKVRAPGGAITRHEFPPSMFLQKFCRFFVRNFQNKIPCLLRASYVHVFDSLRLNKWCNIRVSEGYFIAKYKKNFPGILSSVFALQTFLYSLLLYTLTSALQKNI